MAIGRIPEPGTGIPESIVDAKGDLVTATAADTPARLAVGTNEHRLVADSGETTGLKYVADTTNYAIAAKGDLLVGTAADTLSALSVGTDGYTLVADSGEATGLKWAAAGGVTGWTAFTPTWTNLTVGNGTVVAAYRDNGDMIDCAIKITWGSTTSVSGNVSFALPITGSSNLTELILTCGEALDTGANYYQSGIWFPNGTTARLSVFKANVTNDFIELNNLNATSPVTWGNTDIFNYSFSYRKA